MSGPEGRSPDDDDEGEVLNPDVPEVEIGGEAIFEPPPRVIVVDFAAARAERDAAAARAARPAAAAPERRQWMPAISHNELRAKLLIDQASRAAEQSPTGVVWLAIHFFDARFSATVNNEWRIRLESIGCSLQANESEGPFVTESILSVPGGVFENAGNLILLEIWLREFLEHATKNGARIIRTWQPLLHVST